MNCVSTMGKQNSLMGKTGENKGKLFYENSNLGNLCETGGGNEREIIGTFVFTTSFNCTVLHVMGLRPL